jgi:hypothetical protein
VTASIASFVSEALAILEVEAPAAYGTIARLLDDYPCRCEFVGEGFDVRGTGGRAEARHRRSGRSRVNVAATAGAVVRLLDGTVTLEGLLTTEELRVAGDAEGLMALATISELAIEGGLRSLDMLALFERFRAHAALVTKTPDERFDDR